MGRQDADYSLNLVMKDEKMKMDVVNAIKEGKDPVDIIINQGKTKEEQKQDSQDIINYGLSPKYVTVNRDDVILNIPNYVNRESHKKILKVFEVLGELTDEIKHRIFVLDLARDAYTYFYKAVEREFDEKKIKSYLHVREVLEDCYDSADEGSRRELQGGKYTQGLADNIFGLSADNVSREEMIKKLHSNMIASDFITIVYMIHAINSMYLDKINPIYRDAVLENYVIYSRVLKEIIMKDVPEDDKLQELYTYVGYSIQKSMSVEKSLNYMLNVNGMTDEEALAIIFNMVGKENLRDFAIHQAEAVVARKGVRNYFIKNRIITEEELKEHVDKELAKVLFYRDGNAEFIKYMDTKEIVNLYLDGNIKQATFEKYVKLRDLLCADIDRAQKMEVLKSGNGKRLYDQADSSLIWEVYEKDGFSTEDMSVLESLRYMHPKTIIKNYYANKQRKISVELGNIQAISDEKLYGFFTPELVLKELKLSSKDISLKFYSEDLKQIYAIHGKNLESEILDLLRAECMDNNKKLVQECFKLYSEGFFSADTLVTAEISETECVNYYNNVQDEATLIEFFNKGLISQDSVYEMFGDEFANKSLSLIQAGMDTTVISGLYSTPELISMIRYGVLSIQNLEKIKDDIKTGVHSKSKEQTLMDMYLNDNLTYAELHDLVNAGIITLDEANSIDDAYSEIKGLDELFGKGLKGLPLDYLYDDSSLIIPQPIPNPNNRDKKTHIKPVGMDRNLIIEFYRSMNVQQIKQIDPDQCPVFEGYTLIPVIEKKICFLEGLDGTRTYILPLKIVLEQIKNPKGSLDLIGNATSRNQFNNNKKYIESANHSLNWGRNVAIKMAKVSPVMSTDDAKAFIAQSTQILSKLEQSYKKRKETAKKVLR